MSFITLIDYHYSTVVRFYAKNPSARKVKINWLMTDSEPDFAFQRDASAKENKKMVLPDLNVYEQADQVIKAIELRTDAYIDYARNPIARHAL